MGIGGEAQPQQTQSAVRPHQGLPSVSLFLSFISLFFIQNSVRRRTCRTHDATAREGQRLRRTLRWSPLRALNLLNTPFRGLPLEGDAFNSSNPLLFALFVSFRTHSRSSRINNAAFFAHNCITLYMFIYDMLHPYILVRTNTPWAYVPRIMV